MRKVFADSVYWVALLNPQDAFHRSALNAAQENKESIIVTTEAVLSEVLNLFSSYGPQWRTTVAAEIENLLRVDTIAVVPTSHELFVRALSLYKSRPDKSYSHVDCISMTVMKEEDIAEVLTSDHHFSQEGFSLLLK